MVCENKLYFCLKILVPGLTQTNLFELKPYTSLYLQEPKNSLTPSLNQCSFSIICIPDVKIKFIQFVLVSELSFPMGGCSAFLQNLCFVFFAPPYPGSLAANLRHRPLLAPEPRHLCHDQSQGRVDQRLEI